MTRQTQSWLWALRQAPELMAILNRHTAEMNVIVDEYMVDEAERAAAHFEKQEARRDD